MNKFNLLLAYSGTRLQSSFSADGQADYSALLEFEELPLSFGETQDIR